MILPVGTKAIYPSRGACRIAGVVKRLVDGTTMSFYHLALLDERGVDLFVPVDKIEAIGVRLLLESAEIPKLLDRLSQPTQAVNDIRQRARNNFKLLTSGSAFDLAEIIHSLTELSQTKTLSLGEQTTLGRARRLLIREISEVMSESEAAVEEHVEKALKSLRVDIPANQVNAA
jgi:RNA polymerase-interacting CarD/CdnL/TRCF family regulator